MPEIRYPEVEVSLTETDGNSMFLVAAVGKALRRALDEDGNRYIFHEEISEFRKDALSGDYDHVLQTCMAWVTTH